MAFNPKNEQLTKAVRKDSALFNNEDEHETTKHYTFTLQPSVRKRLDAVAKEKGFKSASKFLNALISEL